jgi:hypothetical protein
MMSVRTATLCEGKYAFDVSDGQMVAARRHGVDWPAALDWRYSTAIVAMLERIVDLEIEAGGLDAQLQSIALDSTREDAAANRYHQTLGAKWMCEAIVREMETVFEKNTNAVEFGRHIWRKWEDDSYWRPGEKQEG